MSAKHTPGPLRLFQVGDNLEFLCPGTEDGESILTITHEGNTAFAVVLSDMNARRLVACWNACEKVSTEDLESIKRPGDVSWAMTIDRLARERDELLAALQEAKSNAGNPEAVYRITSAAIAKATGEMP